MDVFNIATLFNNLNHYVAARSPLEFKDSDKLLSTVEKLTELAIQGYEQPIRDILQTRYAGKISGFNRITVGEKSVSGEFFDMYSPFRTTRHTFYISPTRIDIGVIGGSMPVYSEVDFASAVNKACGDGKKPCKVKRGSTEYFRCVPKTWKCADEKAALKGAIKEETKRVKSAGSSKPSPKEAKVIAGIIAKGIEAQQKGTRKSKNKYDVKPEAKKSEKTTKPEQRSLLEGMFPQSRNVPGADKLNDALGEIKSAKTAKSRPAKTSKKQSKLDETKDKPRSGWDQLVAEKGKPDSGLTKELLTGEDFKKTAKDGLDQLERNQQDIDKQVEDALKRFPQLGDAKPATTGKPKKITKEDVQATPWMYSASQYQNAHDVKQPWIAEISPMQMGMMSERAKKAYFAKRSKEWDASAAIKQEWADKVYEAYKQGKFRLEDTPESRSMFETSARSVISARKAAESKAEKDALMKAAKSQNQIISTEDIVVGDRAFDALYGNYGTITKTFKNSVRFADDKGGERSVNVGRLNWRSRNDLEKAALNGEEIRQPKPVVTDDATSNKSDKVKKESAPKIKVTDTTSEELLGKSFGSGETDLMKNVRETAKEVGWGEYSYFTGRLYDAKNVISNTKNPENYEIVRLKRKGSDTMYMIAKKKAEDKPTSKTQSSLEQQPNTPKLKPFYADRLDQIGTGYYSTVKRGFSKGDGTLQPPQVIRDNVRGIINSAREELGSYINGFVRGKNSIGQTIPKSQRISNGHNAQELLNYLTAIKSRYGEYVDMGTSNGVFLERATRGLDSYIREQFPERKRFPKLDDKADFQEWVAIFDATPSRATLAFNLLSAIRPSNQGS